ncbi:MAG: hypothetical protein JXA30_04455 [Deltaproteobacteria bacterium]|nr:hypothetical protein [Deltaproteobacteria bacterium]
MLFDDPLGGFSTDDVVLQLDTDATRQELKARSEKEKARRAVAEARENEDRKVAAIARYGDTPANLFSAIVYAARVLWRRYRLRLDVRRLRDAREQARDHLHQSLCAVGEVMYNRGDSREMQPYRDQIQAITNARQTIQELRTSHQQVRASSVEMMQDVMQAIKDVQLRTEPLRVEESRLLEELGQYEKSRQSQQQLIEKAELEHKALMQNAAAKPDPSFLAAVDRERGKRQEKLDSVMDKIRGVNDQLERVRSRLQEAKQQIDSFHQQRKSLHMDRARDERQHELKSSDAQSAYERAKATLGERGLIDDLGQIAKTEIDKARSAKQNLQEIEQQVILYEKAKAAYDSRAFLRGSWLLGALIALVMVAFIGLSFLMPNHERSAEADQSTVQE